MLPVGYDGIIVDSNAAAQGNTNPPNKFNLHDIDRPAGYATILDDPSYGNNEFADHQAWENSSLTGFYIKSGNIEYDYPNPAGLQTSESDIGY